MLESSGVSHHARTVPNCVGNETSLFDCKELLDSDVACNYVLAECTEEVAGECIVSRFVGFLALDSRIGVHFVEDLTT